MSYPFPDSFDTRLDLEVSKAFLPEVGQLADQAYVDSLNRAELDRHLYGLDRILETALSDSTKILITAFRSVVIMRIESTLG